MASPRIIPPDEAREWLADGTGKMSTETRENLAHTAAMLGEQREAALRLHPDDHVCIDESGHAWHYLPGLTKCPTALALGET